MSQGKYSTRNGCKLNRRDLNRFFGKKVGRPDDECWEMENWLSNTIAGTDVPRDNYYVESYLDVFAFMKTCGVTPAMLQKWFAERRIHVWVVIEKQNDDYVWCWFMKSRQISDWKPLGEDSPILYKLVPNESGFGYSRVLLSE